ncbi:pimeloyl-[acyl-carrier protein] methyl ester esterase [Pseudomonas duriflava]|uniref:Pimeloyl-[acyl-carrier protein] methyl ester esterase n=1 Tax=Pseudomonas duriflava TaxID=459528 RepID=A0A562QJ36_9PSED|nr:alpha/beta fold hydrolase [Pseudomonas duriflava]TWI56751.1 pimeloyl-[acyl-carrier protein] methyl ester esterase [Pseudomonas duriflava]
MRDTLVLLPGWGLGTAPLEPLRDELLEIAPYLDVHIEPLPELADVSAWFDDLDARLPDKVWLGGWSLGGMIASELTQRRSDRILGLITLGSNPCFVARHGWQSAMSRTVFTDFYEACTLDAELTLKRFTHLVSQGARDRKTLTRLLQVTLPETSGDVAVAGLELLAQLDTREALKAYNGPQLHLFAANDALVPVAAAHALLEEVPDVNVHVFEPASHGLPLERPDELATVINRFIYEGRDG